MRPGRKALLLAVAAAAGLLMLVLWYGRFHWELLVLGYLEGRAAAALGLEVHVRSLSIVPAGALCLEGLEIGGSRDPGAGPLLRVERIDGEVSWRELLNGRIHFRDISVVAPVLRIARDSQGQWNLPLAAPSGGPSGTGPAGRLAIDSLRIRSGVIVLPAEVGGGCVEDLDLRVIGFSGRAGSPTDLLGSGSWAGKGKIAIEGQAYPGDVPFRGSFSLSATGLDLSELRHLGEPYGFDTAEASLDVSLRAAGDLEEGFRVRSKMALWRLGCGWLRKGTSDAQLEAELFYDPGEKRLEARSVELTAGEALSLSLQGEVTDLGGDNRYHAEVRAGRLDLGALQAGRRMEGRGVLSTAGLRLEGRGGASLPAIEGAARIEQGGVRLETVGLARIEAELRFEAGRRMSIRALSPALLEVDGGGVSGGPFGVRFSGSVEGALEEPEFAGHLSVVTAGTGMESAPFSFGRAEVTVQGSRDRDGLRGHGQVGGTDVRVRGLALPRVSLASGFELREGGAVLEDLRLEGRGVQGAAAAVSATWGEQGHSIRAEVSGLSLELERARAGCKGTAATVQVLRSPQGVSGECRLSIREARVRGIPLGPVSGTGSWAPQGFQGRIREDGPSGRAVRLEMKGRGNNGPFPIEISMRVDNLDLGPIVRADPDLFGSRYRLSGLVRAARFDGSVDSSSLLRGDFSVRGEKIGLASLEAGRDLFQDASIEARASFTGKDADGSCELGVGAVRVALAGRAESFGGAGPPKSPPAPHAP
ncbi:MAG: hypothetical protein AB1640_25050, partial [bacterium]